MIIFCENVRSVMTTSCARPNVHRKLSASDCRVDGNFRVATRR